MSRLPGSSRDGRIPSDSILPHCSLHTGSPDWTLRTQAIFNAVLKISYDNNMQVREKETETERDRERERGGKRGERERERERELSLKHSCL